LTGLEIELTDTTEFQRLRYIKQLGTAHLIFPTAFHTRFDHSLGTLAMAQKIIGSINERADGAVIDDEQAALIRISALLHDVTHVPFGHTFEDERKLFERHDEGDRLSHFLLDDRSELARILLREGITDTVYELVASKRRDGEPVELPAFMGQIVANSLSADLFDYVKRDLLFTGLKQDYDERVFSYFELRDGYLVMNLEKSGILRGDGLNEILNLLRLRYTLAERVYYHHAKACSAAMLSKAVECAADLREADLLGIGDEGLLSRLEGDFATDATKRIVTKLRRRKLYKRAYQLNYAAMNGSADVETFVARFHESLAGRRNAERDIREAAGLSDDDGAVIIYCPASKMYFKEAHVRTVIPRGRLVRLSDFGDANPARADVNLLEAKYRALWNFYVFVDRELLDRRHRIAAACREMFRHESVFVP